MRTDRFREAVGAGTGWKRRAGRGGTVRERN